VEIVSVDFCATQVEDQPSVTKIKKEVIQIKLLNLRNFICILRQVFKNYCLLLTHLFK